MQEFQKGQRVKVEFEGTVIALYDHDNCVKIDDGARYHYVYLASPKVKVTLVSPKDWPPRVGDIWATKEGTEPVQEWFGCTLGEGGDLVLTAEHRRWLYPDSFKNLNPVLVRRRGQ